MYKVTIPKKSGGRRTIYVPTLAEQRTLRSWLHYLHTAQEALLPPHVAHGFVRKRSPVTNASWHSGYQYTLSLDLETWFDSVTPQHIDHVYQSWVKQYDHRPWVVEFNTRMWNGMVEDCFVDGIAGQGLATSPLIANIAASPMDWEIVTQRDGWVYTRYADDLTVSAHSMDVIRRAEEVVRAAVRRRGWKVNDRKRRVQWAQHGRRIITGVAVDADGVHPTRAMRRKLRAAMHQGSTSTGGYLGWVNHCSEIPTEYQRVLASAALEFDKTSEAYWSMF